MSKCVIDAAEAVAEVGKAYPTVGKLVGSYFSTNLTRLFKQGEVKAAQRMLTGINIGMAETVARFANEANLPEEFVRAGDVAIKAKKGKIGKREAQQASVMNQYGLAKGYARISGIPRNYFKDNKPLAGGKGINLFIRQLDLHDGFLRASGVPLTTVKPGVLEGALHYSHLTFGDLGKLFAQTGKAKNFGEYFLRSPKAAENVQSQNAAEAVRRIIEHADTFGKIDLDNDLAVLRPQIIDALKNPSGLGAPKAGTAAREGYDAATTWANGAGADIIEKLADELLNEDLLVNVLKANEQMRIVNMTLAKGDGLTMTDGVLKMITSLPNTNDRLYAYGDFLLQDRFRKIFSTDALAKMTPEEMNLAFGENFLAKFFQGIHDESLKSIQMINGRTVSRSKDKAAARKTGTKTRKEANANKQKEFEEISAASADKARQEVATVPEARVAEASLEAAELARRYHLEFEVGPLLGGVVRATSWLSDKVTMGGKMKTMLIGTEHFRLENAAQMSAQLGKLWKEFGQDTNLINQTFTRLQGVDLATQLPEVLASMPEAQAKLAAPLAEFIQQVFGIGERNNIHLHGINEDDFVKSLRSLGATKLADQIDDALGGAGYADNALGEWWKGIEVAADENALTIMGKVYAAQQLSAIKPTMAASLIHHFSHVADFGGDAAGYAKAQKAGYLPLASTNPLSQYLSVGDKPALFHPDIINKMSAVNAYLEYERAFGGKVQKLFNAVDPVIGVLKSSITIWRPGHHMVSMIGNVLFNSIAGVQFPDYAVAMKMLQKRGDVLDLDENALTKALRDGTPAGQVLKVGTDTVRIQIGKGVEEVPLEVLLRGADEIAGVPISPRRTKDLPDETNPNQFGVGGFVQSNPFTRNIAAADHKIAQIAAVRDNLARYALYVKELRAGGPYASLEDAILAAGQKVHEYHPTVGTLTAGERKYARRLFYFYTWQKQALFKILEEAANKPAVITIPSKLQYALATGAGLNPESYGDPYDPEGFYASYYTNSVYGPQFVDETLGAIGFKPSSPQLDVIDSYFSSFNVQGGRGFWEGMGDMISNGVTNIVGKNITPIAKIPMELFTGNKIGDFGKVDNIGEYLVDQTGLGGVSRMTGYLPWGEQRTDFKEGQYGQADRERQQWNFITGLKSTYYQSPQALETYRLEQIDYWNRIYKIGKYYEGN